MQISKISLYVRVQKKNYPEDFVFLILGLLELYTRKVCEMFVYKQTGIIEYVKN